MKKILRKNDSFEEGKNLANAWLGQVALCVCILFLIGVIAGLLLLPHINSWGPGLPSGMKI